MNEDKIKCSIAILTYNSERRLKRCLDSVKDFAEVVICDGGSTDKTLDIARKYNCKIVSQSDPDKQIVDFSRERNIALDLSHYDWHFYLDSDEILSDELRDEIRNICESKNIKYCVYKVALKTTNSDLSIVYKQYNNFYQIRFFNKKCGARFRKKIHEKIFFDNNKYKVGTLKACWYVPWEDDDLIFSNYKRKIDYRVNKIVLNEALFNKKFLEFTYIVIRDFLVSILKRIYKAIYLRLRYRWSELVPLKLVGFRIYFEYALFRDRIKNYYKKNDKKFY